MDGIKILGQNSNNLSYADSTTLLAENQIDLEEFTMKVKVKKNTKSRLNIKNTINPDFNEPFWWKRHYVKSKYH